MSSVSVMSWHLLPENQERYAQEVRQLRSASRSRGLEVQDLADGSTVFVVDTLEPPGYRIYLKTPPRYPFVSPTLLVEKDGKSINVQPAGLLNWQPDTTMAELVDQVAHHGAQRRLTMIVGLGGGLVAALSVVIVTLLLLSIKQLDGVAKDQTAVAGRSTALAQQKATVMAGLAANANDPNMITALAGIDAEQSANANRANQLLTAQALQATSTAQVATQGALLGKANEEQSGTATANANNLSTAVAQATIGYLTANAPTATPLPAQPTAVPVIPTAQPVVRTTVRQEPTATPGPVTTEAAPTVFFVPTPVFIPTPSVAPFIPTARPQPTDTPVPVRNTPVPPPPTTNPPTTAPATQSEGGSGSNSGGSSGGGSPKTTQPPAKTTIVAQTTQPPTQTTIVAQTTQPPAKTTQPPPPPKTTVAATALPTPTPPRPTMELPTPR